MGSLLLSAEGSVPEAASVFVKKDEQMSGSVKDREAPGSDFLLDLMKWLVSDVGRELHRSAVSQCYEGRHATPWKGACGSDPGI